VFITSITEKIQILIDIGQPLFEKSGIWLWPPTVVRVIFLKAGPAYFYFRALFSMGLRNLIKIITAIFEKNRHFYFWDPS
jgi:hypothetical protein